jgi:hypothetical protein
VVANTVPPEVRREGYAAETHTVWPWDQERADQRVDAAGYTAMAESLARMRMIVSGWSAEVRLGGATGPRDLVRT